MKIDLSTKENVLNYINSPLVPDGPWDGYGYATEDEDNEDLAESHTFMSTYLPGDPVVLRIPDDFLKDPDVIFELAKKSHYTFVKTWADKSILDDEEKLVRIYGKSVYIVDAADHAYLKNKDFLIKALDYGTEFVNFVDDDIRKDINYAEKVTSILGMDGVHRTYSDSYNPEHVSLPLEYKSIIDESLYSDPRIKKANLAYLCKVPLKSMPDDETLIKILLARSTDLIQMHYNDVTEYDNDIDLICKTLEHDNDYIEHVPEELLDDPKIYNAYIQTIISHRDGKCAGFHCTHVMQIPKKLRKNKSFMKRAMGHIRFDFDELDDETKEMISDLKDFIFTSYEPLNYNRLPESYLEQKDWLMFSITHEPKTIESLRYNSKLKGDPDVFHTLFFKDRDLALNYAKDYLKENDDPAIARLTALYKGPAYVPSKYLDKQLLLDAVCLNTNFNDVFNREDISKELRRDKDIAKAIAISNTGLCWPLMDMDLSVFDDKEIYNTVMKNNNFVIAAYEKAKNGPNEISDTIENNALTELRSCFFDEFIPVAENPIENNDSDTTILNKFLNT